MSGPLSIKCNLVRAGSLYNNGQEVPMISDGTIILMADLENPTTQKFIRIGNALERFLKEELPYIFDPSFIRRFPTMWCDSSTLFLCHSRLFPVVLKVFIYSFVIFRGIPIHTC